MEVIVQHRKRHSHSHHSSDQTAPSRKSLALLLVLLVTQLMVILDITAVNIALPSLAKDLQLSGSQISWTITSYSLVFGSLLLFGGRAADLLGRRRLFLTGLGVFTTASLASALAGTATALFAARAGQGLGAAMLSPAALSIITTCFHGHAKAKALAAWGAVGGAGAAIGVLAGGLLTEFADWRMIFFVNLPVAVALAITAVKVIPSDTEKPRWRGLDLRGAFVATTSLGAIVYAITQGSSAGWTSTQTLGFALAGLAGLAAFAVLPGARATESGIISGLTSTRHEPGGTVGIAISSPTAAGSGVLAGPQAAAGISRAFVGAAILASVATLGSLAALPRAGHFV